MPNRGPLLKTGRPFARVGACVLSCAMIGLAACGGGGSGGDEAKTTVSFVYAGPVDDGGYNQSQQDIGLAVADEFEGQVEVNDVDNTPYTAQAGRVLEQLVAQGTDMIYDTAAYGDAFFKVCGENPELACITTYPLGKPFPLGGLPKNVSGTYYEFWNQDFVLGAAAGLMTESATIGFVSPGEFPLITSAMNSFMLGCQEVNPKCQMRVIHINTYYDPTKSSQAARTLADAGADVLTGWQNDSSVCQVAEEEGLLSIGHYRDYRSSCPNAFIRNAVDGGAKWYIEQVRALVDGTWKGGEFKLFELGEGADLSSWGKSVPEDVRRRVGQIFEELKSGELTPFVGPIADNKGKVRVQEGEKLSDEFLYGQWDWPVEGIVGS